VRSRAAAISAAAGRGVAIVDDSTEALVVLLLGFFVGQAQHGLRQLVQLGQPVLGRAERLRVAGDGEVGRLLADHQRDGFLLLRRLAELPGLVRDLLLDVGAEEHVRAEEDVGVGPVLPRMCWTTATAFDDVTQ